MSLNRATFGPLALAAAFVCSIATFADEKTDAQEIAKLQGKWQVMSITADFEGEPVKEEKLQGYFWTIKESTITSFEDGKPTATMAIRLNSGASPKQIDMTLQGGEGAGLGIYELSGDTLRICFDDSVKDRKRPAAFEVPKNSPNVLLSLKKVNAVGF